MYHHSDHPQDHTIHTEHTVLMLDENTKLVSSNIFRGRKSVSQSSLKTCHLRQLCRIALAYQQCSNFPSEFQSEVDYVKSLGVDDPNNILEMCESLTSLSLESFPVLQQESDQLKEFPALFASETTFLKVSQILTVKTLMQFKKIQRIPLSLQSLLLAFVVVFNDLKLPENLSKTSHQNLEIVKNQFANPGKTIQKIRDFPSRARNKKVSFKTIKSAKKLIEKNLTLKCPDQFKAVRCTILQAIRLYQLYEPIHAYRKVQPEKFAVHKKSQSRGSCDQDRPVRHRSSLSNIPNLTATFGKKASLLNKFFKTVSEIPYDGSERCTSKTSHSKLRLKGMRNFPIQALIIQRNQQHKNPKLLRRCLQKSKENNV